MFDKYAPNTKDVINKDILFLNWSLGYRDEKYWRKSMFHFFIILICSKSMNNIKKVHSIRFQCIITNENYFVKEIFQFKWDFSTK